MYQGNAQGPVTKAMMTEGPWSQIDPEFDEPTEGPELTQLLSHLVEGLPPTPRGETKS